MIPDSAFAPEPLTECSEDDRMKGSQYMEKHAVFKRMTQAEKQRPIPLMKIGEKVDIWLRNANSVENAPTVSNVPMRFDYSHGFNWGYAGTGPQALSLCILYHFTDGDLKFTTDWMLPFLCEFIQFLPQSTGVIIAKDSVIKWIEEKRTLSSPFPLSHRYQPTQPGFVYNNEGRCQEAPQTLN